MNSVRNLEVDRIERETGLADRLCALPTVVSARRLSGRWLVVPSPEAIRRIRREGRAGLVGEWRSTLGCEDPGSDVWSIVEVMPRPGSSEEVQWAWPLRQPWVDHVETDGDDTLRASIRVPLDLDVFRGHFPAIPIVPGAMQIDWVMVQLRTHLKPAARFVGLQGAKFQRLVRPAMSLTLAIRVSGNLLRFEYACADSAVSAGRIEIGGDLA